MTSPQTHTIDAPWLFPATDLDGDSEALWLGSIDRVRVCRYDIGQGQHRMAVWVYQRGVAHRVDVFDTDTQAQECASELRTHIDMTKASEYAS